MDEIGLKFHPDVGQFLADPSPHKQTVNMLVAPDSADERVRQRSGQAGAVAGVRPRQSSGLV
jgi:hypothetical protein